MNRQFRTGDSADEENMACLIATTILPGTELLEALRSPSDSKQGKEPSIQRDFGDAFQALVDHYMSSNAKYGNFEFVRRFTMSHSLFDRIGN